MNINVEKENNDTSVWILFLKLEAWLFYGRGYQVVGNAWILKTKLTYKIIVTSWYIVEIRNAVISVAIRCTIFTIALAEHEKP